MTDKCILELIYQLSWRSWKSIALPCSLVPMHYSHNVRRPFMAIDATLQSKHNPFRRRSSLSFSLFLSSIFEFSFNSNRLARMRSRITQIGIKNFLSNHHERCASAECQHGQTTDLIQWCRIMVLDCTNGKKNDEWPRQCLTLCAIVMCDTAIEQTAIASPVRVDDYLLLNFFRYCFRHFSVLFLYAYLASIVCDENIIQFVHAIIIIQCQCGSPKVDRKVMRRRNELCNS